MYEESYILRNFTGCSLYAVKSRLIGVGHVARIGVTRNDTEVWLENLNGIGDSCKIS
jgi:hypothetical protein